MANRAKTPPTPKKPTTKPAGSRRGLWIALVAASLVAVVVAGGLVVLSQRSNDPASGGGANAADVATGDLKGVKKVEDRFAGIPQDGAMLGDPNAPVTISEYADLRCPACRTFALDFMPAVITDLVKTGKAKYEFRLWPILGPDSVLAAQAAIAAQQQNKLFEYQDLWYINQQDESSDYATDAYVDGVAKALGLDIAAFQKARADEALWGPDLQDIQVIAAQQGLGGTPAFIITGPKGSKVLTGSIPTAETIVETVKEVS